MGWGGQAGDAILKRELSFQSLDFLERRQPAKEAVGGKLVTPACQATQTEKEEDCSPDSGCSSLLGQKVRELLATLEWLGLRGEKPGNW